MIHQEEISARMYFFRQLGTFHLLQAILIQFYTATIDNIHTSAITIWFGADSSREKRKLQYTIKKITGCGLSPIEVLHIVRTKRRAGRIISVTYLPLC